MSRLADRRWPVVIPAVLLALSACTSAPPTADPEEPSASGSPTAVVDPTPSSSSTPSTSAPVTTDAPSPVETAQPPTDTRVLDVSLTSAQWVTETSAVEVVGFVADVVESGGRCTATLVGSTTVSVEAPGNADASSTVCSVVVPRSKLAAGTWRATLAYSSSSGAGTTAPVEVVVP